LGLKAEVSGFPFGKTYPGVKVLWVETPEDHPIVSGLLEKISGSPEDEEEEPEEVDETGDTTPIDVLRAQAHGCFSCAHKNVCAIATNPLLEIHKIVISACQAHVSAGDD
jgi:hypothetical protein